MASSSDQKCMLTQCFEQRAVIKFCGSSGVTPKETRKLFSDNDSGKMCSRTIVFDWHKLFRVGRSDTNVVFWSGKPCISGAGCSKLTTSLVNISLKFQT